VKTLSQLVKILSLLLIALSLLLNIILGVAIFFICECYYTSGSPSM
jgi:hypothetical protein